MTTTADTFETWRVLNRSAYLSKSATTRLHVVRVRRSKVPDDPEIQNALLAIHARLGTIEGKINLVARAEREEIISVLQEAVRENPLLGQIYLLLDGNRTQQDVLNELTSQGIATSQPTVSRRMADLVTEYGIADTVGSGAVLRKNRAAEDVLNLTRRVRRWLEDGSHQLPEKPARRSRRKK
jgi:hypothetical protein